MAFLVVGMADLALSVTNAAQVPVPELGTATPAQLCAFGVEGLGDSEVGADFRSSLNFRQGARPAVPGDVGGPVRRLARGVHGDGQ